MSKLKLKTSILILLLTFIAGDLRALAQSTTGTISGTVVDQQQAVIPAASVTVRNLNTNATRTANTDSDGAFRFPGLAVGTYELTVEQTGFGKYIQSPITLVLNQEAVVPVTLMTRGTQEVVTVTTDVA
jgi:hypothetical protein